MMTAIEILALDKALKKKDAEWARKAVVSGTFPVDVTVRLCGDVSVGEDTKKKSTNSFLSEDFLIMVLHMAGCTRDRAAEIIETVATACLVTAANSEDKDEAKRVREAMVEKFDSDGFIRETIAGIKERIPMTPVKGSVSFKGAVEVVTSAAAVEEARSA
jgi:hypothetical protein